MALSFGDAEADRARMAAIAAFGRIGTTPQNEYWNESESSSRLRSTPKAATSPQKVVIIVPR
jgi:hypothetical protein